MIIEAERFFGILDYIDPLKITENNKYYVIAINWGFMKEFGIVEDNFLIKMRRDFQELLFKYGKKDNNRFGEDEEKVKTLIMHQLDMYSDNCILKFNINYKDEVKEVIDKYYSTVYIQELIRIETKEGVKWWWEENT